MLPISPDAADAVHRIAAERGTPPSVRVRVLAGGCSGLTWDLSVGDLALPNDQRKVSDGVTVLVDAASAPFLRGARIDLGRPPETALREPVVDAESGNALVVAGLRAQHVCGCGESFAAS